MGNTLVTERRFLAQSRVRARTNLEAPGYGKRPRLLPSSHRNADGVVASSAVGSAHLEGVLAGFGVPLVDPLPPGIQGELFREAGLVPGRAAVGRDLDTLDATVGRPGDAADRGLAGRDLCAVLYGVDAGLGLYGALLRPGALDPVRIEVPVGELYLAKPLGRRDVAVEAGDHEAHGVAVLDRELAAVQAEGDQRLAAVKRDVRSEARGEAVHAAAHELLGGTRDLVAAHPRLGEHVGEQNPGPAPVRDEPATDGIGDARERDVRLAGGHAEEVLVGELYRVVHGALDRELPGAHVYPGRLEGRVYEVEAAGWRDEVRHPRHVYRRVLGRRRERLVLDGFLRTTLLATFVAAFIAAFAT